MPSDVTVTALNIVCKVQPRSVAIVSLAIFKAKSTDMSSFLNTLAITASIPFVNAHWMTDLFVAKSGTAVCFKNKVEGMIESLSLPTHCKDFLLCLAQNVDGLQSDVQTRNELAAFIGLSTALPLQNEDGYISAPNHRRSFFYPFMCALVLDKCMWTLGFENDMQEIQWVHPLSGDMAAPLPTDEGHHMDLLRSFWISYGSRGSFDTARIKAQEVAWNANVAVKSASYKSTADLSSAVGNIYYMASTLISLKNEHLKEVIAAIGSDVHRPPTLTKKLGE
ncbi:hypothetical protein K439DRAFT_1625535, partial [Ramaria rubella]